MKFQIDTLWILATFVPDIFYHIGGIHLVYIWHVSCLFINFIKYDDSFLNHSVFLYFLYCTLSFVRLYNQHKKYAYSTLTKLLWNNVQ